MSAFLAAVRRWILGFLKVPPEPHPPAGSPGSLKVFRAGDNYGRLLLWGWIAKQVVLVLAFLFWIGLAHRFIPEEIPFEQKSRGGRRTTKIIRIEEYRGWFNLFETAGFVFGVLQMPFTYVLTMMRFEMRWYMVTDRSLRIREGIGSVKEMTLSFANIQQITVRQNPFQRLFGLADVEVKSAGGGSGGHGHNGQPLESWHTGVFRHVSNAEEIRDLIVTRQRALKAAGLGDPDEHDHPVEAEPVTTPVVQVATNETTVEAARELLSEARALRSVLSPRQTPG